jgi:hypothetical protein
MGFHLAFNGLMICTAHPSIVQVIKSRRMRWAGYIARMGKGEVYTGVWWGNIRERVYLGDRGLDKRIILRWIFRKRGCGGMDWIKLARDRDRWRTLVNAVMNFRVS